MAEKRWPQQLSEQAYRLRVAAIRINDGNIHAAAQALQIHPTTLYLWAAKEGLRRIRRRKRKAVKYSDAVIVKALARAGSVKGAAKILGCGVCVIYSRTIIADVRRAVHHVAVAQQRANKRQLKRAAKVAKASKAAVKTLRKLENCLEAK